MNSLMQRKIVELLVQVNIAITSLRLYPPASPMIISAVDKLQQALTALFDESESLVLAEAEKKLLVNGELLDQIDQDRIPVKLFIDMLLRFRVRSLTFERGLESQELKDFLKIIGEMRESNLGEGGIRQVMADSRLPHIYLDQKLYIVKDSDRSIVAGLDVRDEDIIQFLISNNPDAYLDALRLKEMANDPEWIAQIFQKGMDEVLQQKASLSNIQLSENLVRMIGLFEKVMEKMDQDMISLLVGKAFADLDADTISLIMTYDMDHFFNGKLFQDILNHMDEEKFAQVVGVVQIMGNSAVAKTLQDMPAGRKMFERIYSELMTSDKGMKLQQEMDEKQSREKDKRDRHLTELKARIDATLLADDEAFLDDRLMESIPDLVVQSTELEDLESYEELIQYLEKGLFRHEKPIRDRASAALSQVFERLPQDRFATLMDRLSDTLVRWIEMETSATFAYKKICRKLGDQIGEWIAGKLFPRCIPALDVFHLIDAGILARNDTAQAIAAEIIRDLASTERMDILFEAFEAKEEGIRDDAGRILARLGDAPLNRLLDRLRDQTDSDERVRILHLLIEIGSPTIPVIRERLDHHEPWYFLRNLVYVLGRFDSSKSIELLGDFLLHPHEKVRQEALQSIQRVGGQNRGSVLLSALPKVEEPFQSSIVQELGNAKYAPAVPMLLELLKTRPRIQSSIKAELDEKICIALGRIGSREATPLLTEISKQNAFFTIKRYPDRVKAAATKALAAITK